MARTPRPPDLIVTLRRTAHALRDRRETAMAGEVEAVLAALQSMLSLTRFNDCLFADEIRNLLNIRHQLPSRRGTDLDPMRADRQRRNK